MSEKLRSRWNEPRKQRTIIISSLMRYAQQVMRNFSERKIDIIIQNSEKLLFKFENLNSHKNFYANFSLFCSLLDFLRKIIELDFPEESLTQFRKSNFIIRFSTLILTFNPHNDFQVTQ